jgi:hypothetical protein
MIRQRDTCSGIAEAALSRDRSWDVGYDPSIRVGRFSIDGDKSIHF